MHIRLPALLLPFALLVACNGAEPGKPAAPGKHDWPQWRGPKRDNINTETGLLKAWPKDGPAIAWKVKGMGTGFSTPSIAQGRIFLMGNVDGKECLMALSEEDGEQIWSTPIGKAGGAGGFEGPRGTPTVDGERVYSLGIHGDLICAQVEDGKILWRKHLQKDFGGSMPGWGYCESILIDGDDLICCPGAKYSMVKLNKMTGDETWTMQTPEVDNAHYSSCIIAEIGGVKQYITFMSGGVVGVDAKDGKFLWRYNKPANRTANCSTPLIKDGLVFGASSYSIGGGLTRVTVRDGKFTAKQVYFTKFMMNHHGGMILLDGHLYGANDNDEHNGLVCMNYETGKVVWDKQTPGKGAIAYAEGRFYFRNEGSGDVFLIEANAERYVEHGRFKQPDRSRAMAWPHPVIANGRLYIRDQDVLIAYDIKEK